MSRLMGSAPSGTFTSAMPARYAYNNQVTNMWLTYFVKPSGNYSTSSCGVTTASGCGSMKATSGETWQ